MGDPNRRVHEYHSGPVRRREIGLR
jgi:hypothetical protein